jgi:hypothetical protein
MSSRNYSPEALSRKTYSPMSSSKHSTVKSVKKHLSVNKECSQKVLMYVGIMLVLTIISSIVMYNVGKSNAKKEDEKKMAANNNRMHAQDRKMKAETERLQKLLSDCRSGGMISRSNQPMQKRLQVPPMKHV